MGNCENKKIKNTKSSSGSGLPGCKEENVTAARGRRQKISPNQCMEDLLRQETV